MKVEVYFELCGKKHTFWFIFDKIYGIFDPNKKILVVGKKIPQKQHVEPECVLKLFARCFGLV